MTRPNLAGSDRLETRIPGGIPIWFGIPFAVGGCFPLAGALGLIEIESEGGGNASPLLLILFSIPFLAVGIGIITYRGGFTVDLRAGSMTRWRRIAFVQFWSRSIRTERLTEVHYFDRVVEGENSSQTVYPVAVRGTSSLEIATCKNKRLARSTAESVAKLLELAVVDRTDGEEHRREFADLDASFRDRRARGSLDVELGDAPSDMKSEIGTEGDDLTIALPSTGMTAAHWGILALLPLAFVPAIIFLVLAEDAPLWFTGGALGMSAVPVLVIAAGVVTRAHRSWGLRVSPSSLSVRTSGPYSTTVTIPANELEDLRVVECHGLIARLGGNVEILAASDVTEVSFGALERPEAQYLTAMITGVVSSHDTASRRP